MNNKTSLGGLYYSQGKHSSNVRYNQQTIPKEILDDRPTSS